MYVWENAISIMLSYTKLVATGHGCCQRRQAIRIRAIAELAKNPELVEGQKNYMINDDDQMKTAMT